MKKLIINRDSWHYKLTSRYGSVNERGDLCDYLKSFFLAAFLLFVTSAMWTLILCFAATLIVIPVVAYFTNDIVTDDLYFALVMLFVIFSVIGYEYFDKPLAIYIQEKTPPFISAIRDQIKNKYCTLIEFEGKKL